MTSLNSRTRQARTGLRRADSDLAIPLAELHASRLFPELGYAALYDQASESFDLDCRETRGLLRPEQEFLIQARRTNNRELE